MSPTIAFFGSSLVSARWNGAATYYRGILRALHDAGYRTVFYEPDAYGRQQHRDIADPPYAEVVVYHEQAGAERCLERAASADILIKASGVGVADEFLERAVLQQRRPGQLVLFWDVDAPATLERVQADPSDPFRSCVSGYDLVLTYGGGSKVVQGYRALGARACVPIYNALDPQTHFPAPSDPRFSGALGLLANRLPDRERRCSEFFFEPAQCLPDVDFVLGGSGWEDRQRAPNVRYLGHVYTHEHNAFNCSTLAVLNVSRDSMARFGHSPATRVFEAAGSGACIITDAWPGLDAFFEPDQEILVATDGDAVCRHLHDLTPQRRRRIGEAAYARVHRDHTYAQRAVLLHRVLSGEASELAS